MDAQYVYGACEAVAYEDGVRIVVHVDEPWRADDPVVKKRPDLFREHPEVPRGTIPVEQATAEPGEKRATKRAAKRG